MSSMALRRYIFDIASRSRYTLVQKSFVIGILFLRKRNGHVYYIIFYHLGSSSYSVLYIIILCETGERGRAKYSRHSVYYIVCRTLPLRVLHVIIISVRYTV